MNFKSIPTPRLLKIHLSPSPHSCNVLPEINSSKENPHLLGGKRFGFALVNWGEGGIVWEKQRQNPDMTFHEIPIGSGPDHYFISSEITTVFLGSFSSLITAKFPRSLLVTAHSFYSSMYELFGTSHLSHFLGFRGKTYPPKSCPEQLTTLSTKKNPKQNIPALFFLHNLYFCDSYMVCLWFVVWLLVVFSNHKHTIYVNPYPSETSGNPTNQRSTAHHLSPNTKHWFIGWIKFRIMELNLSLQLTGK